jgi:cell division protein FtsL
LASRYPLETHDGIRIAAQQDEMRTYRVVLAFVLVLLICAAASVWTWRHTGSLAEEEDVQVDRAAALDEAFELATERDR